MNTAVNNRKQNINVNALVLSSQEDADKDMFNVHPTDMYTKDSVAGATCHDSKGLPSP